MMRWLAFAAAVTVLAAAGCRQQRAASPTVTINGRTWYVEIADTQLLRYQGLSDRPLLDANKGMLFIYPQPQVLDFCMRKCLISLDIAFISADGKVVRTHTMRVEPYGQEKQTYSSHLPAQYALEVSAGELRGAGVKQGDTVLFSGVPEAAKAEPGP
jgi:hypothetical protein